MQAFPKPAGWRRAAGFTIVELLTAISVVALLLAVTIPAVQSARETARRAQCMAHLKNVGMAAESFASAHSRYPDAPRWRQDLLPYLDQATLLSALESEASGLDLVKASVPILTCPSDSESSPAWALSSYFANIGTGLQTFGYNGFLSPSITSGITAGAYGGKNTHGVTRPSDFRDGLSNTAAFSEALITAGPLGASLPNWTDYTSDPRRVAWKLGDELMLPCRLKRLAAECMSLDFLTAEPSGSIGRGWLIWGLGPGSISGEPRTWGYDHLIPPNASPCMLGSYYGTFPASSAHASGANVLFGDGRVSFVSDAVDLTVWRACSNRSMAADDQAVISLQCSGPVF